MADANATKLRALLDGAKHRETFTARTGQLASDTTVNPDARVYDSDGNVIPNRIHIRPGATSANPAGRGSTVAWNFGKVSKRKADLPVTVGYNKAGELEVLGAAAQEADTYLGASADGFYTSDPPAP